MLKTGILRIDNNTGISRLVSGSGSVRLAMHGPGDPFGNATDFLVSVCGLGDGDPIWVTGDAGSASGVSAFFITDAGHAEQAVAVLSAAEAISTGLFVADGASVLRAAGREAASRAGKAASTGKRPTKKSASKKGGTKGGAAKKGSAKKGSTKKGSAKKSRDARSRKGAKKRS